MSSRIPNQAIYGYPSPPPFMMPAEYNSPVLPATQPPKPAVAQPSARPAALLYQPLTTSVVPPGCFEQFVVHPYYKRVQPSPNVRGKWGEPIEFRPISLPINKNVLGTPMHDCFHGFGLEHPETRVLSSWAAANKTHIHFMIDWPGYDWRWVEPISIYDSDGRVVTRAKLAQRISREYKKFSEMCTHSQVQCDFPPWRVGTGRYTFDRMRLSRVYWVSGDVWQAHVSVITDQNGDPNGLKPMRDLTRG